MDYFIEKDNKFRTPLLVCKIVYILTAIAVTVIGIIHKSTYEALLAVSTLVLFPGIYLFRRISKYKGGYQLEFFIYIFSLLSWSLGGAAELYACIPHYDKIIHFLSGIFVSVIALTLFELFERGRDKAGCAEGCVFVFSASMAVAGIFELCEFVLSHITKRDLQRVEFSGVTDTMGDMFVCMLGTLIIIFFMIRAYRGKHDFFTDAAIAFAYQNPKRNRKDDKKQKISHKNK